MIQGRASGLESRPWRRHQAAIARRGATSITGHPDESVPAKAAAAGIRYVLVKPEVEDSLSHIWDAINDEQPSAP